MSAPASTSDSPAATVCVTSERITASVRSLFIALIASTVRWRSIIHRLRLAVFQVDIFSVL